MGELNTVDERGEPPAVWHTRWWNTIDSCVSADEASQVVTDHFLHHARPTSDEAPVVVPQTKILHDLLHFLVEAGFQSLINGWLFVEV